MAAMVVGAINEDAAHAMSRISAKVIFRGRAASIVSTSPLARSRRSVCWAELPMASQLLLGVNKATDHVGAGHVFKFGACEISVLAPFVLRLSKAPVNTRTFPIIASQKITAANDVPTLLMPGILNALGLLICRLPIFADLVGGEARKKHAGSVRCSCQIAQSPPVHAGGRCLDCFDLRSLGSGLGKGRADPAKKSPAECDGARRRAGDAVFSEDAAPS
jgi:hypothetical protein